MADGTPAKPLSTAAIARHATDLNKAMSAGTPAPELFARSLKELREGVAATEDLLRSTRIGVLVNRLKDEKYCKDEKIRDQAAALIKKWKIDIQKKRPGGGTTAATSATGSPAPGAKGTPASGSSTPSGGKADSAPAEKWKSIKPENRNAVNDGVDWKKTGQAARDACVKSLYDGLATMTDQAPTHLLTLALSIEQACYNEHGPETQTAYRERIRLLFLNLKNKASSHLRDGVTATPPTIKPARLVTMSAEDMRSKEMAEADAVIHKENVNNAMTAKEEKAISSMLQCGSCGQRKVSYSQAQTRSADEPMTTFCECTVCGKKWKFS